MSPTYALSAYLPACGLTCVSPGGRHDANVALWRLDKDRLTLEKYWELERYTGLKHHHWGFYTVDALRAFLESLLADMGLRLADITHVWGLHDLGDNQPIYATWQRTPEIPIHSLAHLYSCLALDTDRLEQETIFGMALDAGPDSELSTLSEPYWYCCGLARHGNIEVFPAESPGGLFIAASSLFQSEPGTLMALASASEIGVAADARALSSEGKHYGPGSVDWAVSALRAFTMEIRSGLASDADRRAAHYDKRFTFEENVTSAVMKHVQHASQEIVRRNVERGIREYHLDTSSSHLALAGGFALNCPTNSFLMEQYRFRSLTIPPCANDGGQALGLGLMGFLETVGESRLRYRFAGPYLGNDELQLDEALTEYSRFVESKRSWSIDDVADDLIESPVAWVQGAAEIGPRALGHRSLLGDPRRMDVKDELNRLKRRQWWRPIAPIVLEEEGCNWFRNFRRSPYMLEVLSLLEERIEGAPAIAHLDGTSRVQTLAATDEPCLHEVVRAFFERTGVPMVCNTSLNDRGEPIVDNASQAINFCVRRGVRVVYIGDVRLTLRPVADPERAITGQQLDLPGHRRHSRVFDDVWDDIWAEWLGLDLEPELLFVYCVLGNIRGRFDVRTPEGRAGFGRNALRATRLAPELGAMAIRWVQSFGPDECRRSSRPDPVHTPPFVALAFGSGADPRRFKTVSGQAIG